MPRLNINGSPFRPRSPFSFRTPENILISARRPLEREQEMSREIDRLQEMRRTVFSPSPTGQFGDRFADVAGGGSRFTQTPSREEALRETGFDQGGFLSDIGRGITRTAEMVPKIARFSLGYDPEAIESIKRRQALRQQGGQEAQLAAEEETFKDRSFISPFAVAASLTGPLKGGEIPKVPPKGLPKHKRLPVDENGMVTLYRGHTSSYLDTHGATLPPDQFLTHDRGLAEIYAQRKVLPGDTAEVVTIKVPRNAVKSKEGAYYSTTKAAGITERSPARSVEELKALPSEGGAVPPREPPAPPTEPAGGPPEPPSWESAVSKLNEGIKTSGRRLAKTEIERSADRGRRIAEYRAILQRERAAGPTSEAFRKANAALAGEYAKFDAPKFGLTPQESEAIWARAADFDYGRKAFNQKHVADALLRIEQGEPLRRFEINALRKVYGPDLARQLEKHLQTGSNWDKLANAITIPRTILSSMDVSYPLRQGIKVSVRPPKEFWGNIKPMLKSFASEGVTEHIDDVLSNDSLPIQVTGADGTITGTTWGQVMQDTDILRPLPDAEAHFLSREEGFLSDIANKFPLVRNSARAFITYGNKLRADIGEYWIQRWVKNGEEITPLRLQALGNVLNRFTGRGTLGNKVIAESIQTLGWAPKLTISGPQSALQMFHSDPLIRKIAIENMVSFVGGGVALLSLAKLSGSADF